MKLYLALCVLLQSSHHISRAQNVPGLSAWQAARAAHAEAERRAGAGGNPAALPSRSVQVAVGQKARFAAHEAALQLHAQQVQQFTPSGAVPGISAHAQALQSVQQAERNLGVGGQGAISAHAQAVKDVQEAERRLGNPATKPSRNEAGLKINPENVKRIQNSLTQLITSALSGGSKASRGPSSSISDILSSIIKKRPSPSKIVTKNIQKDTSIDEILASLGIGKISSSRPSRPVIKHKKEEKTVEELTRTISDKLNGRKTIDRFSDDSSRFSSESSRSVKTQSRKVEEGSTYLDRLLAELREEEESTTKQISTDFSFLEDSRSSNRRVASFLDDIEPAKDELSSLLDKSKNLRKGLRTNIDRAVEESNEINQLLLSLKASSPRKVSGSNKKILLDIVPQIDENEVDIEGGIGGDLLKELFSAVPDKAFDDILREELLKAAKEGSATTQNSLEREIRVASSETEKLSAELDQILKELEGLTEDKINLVEESFDDLSLKIRDKQATSKFKDLLEDEEFVNSVLDRFAKLGIPLRPEDVDLNKIETIKTTLTRSIENSAEESRRLGEELQKQLEILEGEKDEGREKAEDLDTISQQIENLLSIL